MMNFEINAFIIVAFGCTQQCFYFATTFYLAMSIQQIIMFNAHLFYPQPIDSFIALVHLTLSTFFFFFFDRNLFIFSSLLFIVVSQKYDTELIASTYFQSVKFISNSLKLSILIVALFERPRKSPHEIYRVISVISDIPICQRAHEPHFLHSIQYQHFRTDRCQLCELLQSTARVFFSAFIFSVFFLFDYSIRPRLILCAYTMQ